MGALPCRALALDQHRMGVDLVRALGLAALSLRIVVLRYRFRVGLVLGRNLGTVLGELGVVARICGLVPIWLLQLLVLELLRGLLPWLLPAPSPAPPRWRRLRPTAAP